MVLKGLTPFDDWQGFGDERGVRVIFLSFVDESLPLLFKVPDDGYPAHVSSRQVSTDRVVELDQVARSQKSLLRLGAEGKSRHSSRRSPEICRHLT